MGIEMTIKIVGISTIYVTVICYRQVVKSPLKDPLRKGPCINYLSIMDVLNPPKFHFVIEITHLWSPKEDNYIAFKKSIPILGGFTVYLHLLSFYD